MLTIPERFHPWVRKQPEYAMGYQLAVVKLSTGSFDSGWIFNGSFFIKRDEFPGMSETDWKLAPILAKYQKTAISIIDIVQVIPRPPEQLKCVRRVSVVNASLRPLSAFSVNEVRASQGAKDSPVTVTLDGDVFKRFSAYENDIRVTETRGLTAGTFGTTAEDAQNVKTGRDAVSRYALENKQSANKRFTIKPPEETKIQQGTVQPAYGELGGGVEVIFVDGSPDNTVTGPDILPE